jgi:hypothetical protein
MDQPIMFPVSDPMSNERCLNGRGLALAVVVALAPAATLAQPAPGPPSGSALDGLYACSAITAPEARLACFDAAVARLRGEEERGEVIALDRARTDAVRREAFGFSMPTLPRFRRPAASPGGQAQPVSPVPVARVARAEETEDSQTYTVVAVSPRASGTIITTSNDQTWLLVDPPAFQPNPRPPFQARIRRASMGSFILQVEGRNRGYRVRRVE